MSSLEKRFALPLDLTPTEFREFQRRHDPGTYRLLDVRQAQEYEQHRLPGATLVPLPELGYRLSELDPDQPTVIYCRSGHRSRAAAQFLLRRDFAQVYDLRGGLRAWDGQAAFGPEAWGLEYVPTDATPGQAAAVALVLEEGLAGLYQDIANQIIDPETSELFRRLADVEQEHVDKVRRLQELHGTNEAESAEAVARVAGHVEGGFSRDALLGHAFQHLEAPDLMLQLAMMIETQAWDLYQRYADGASRPETKALWLDLSRDEQQHLAWLAERLSAYIRVPR